MSARSTRVTGVKYVGFATATPPFYAPGPSLASRHNGTVSPAARRYQEVRDRIARAAEGARRDPAEITLVAVSKTYPVEAIRELYDLGHRDFGESRWQEAQPKIDALPPDITWHFIGHLQSNKIKDILKCNVACIQSLDRFDLAEKLHQRLQAEGKTIEVFIQVNTSDEESKFGASPESAIELVKQVAQLEALKVKGLMTIGLFSYETEKVRACFRLLKSIQQQIIGLKISNVEMNELSMGMSGDMETAIEEGATIIRVGTAVFGQRIYPDSYYWNESKG